MLKNVRITRNAHAHICTQYLYESTNLSIHQYARARHLINVYNARFRKYTASYCEQNTRERLYRVISNCFIFMMN